MAPVPIAPGLFTTGPSPRLIGGRRKADGRIAFPMPGGADAALFDAVELSPEGRLWSFTVQRFRPKSPPYAGDDDEASFRPFALGYVELPEEAIVESRIVAKDFGALHIGAPMRLVLEPFGPAGMVTFAFTPIGDGQ